MPPSNSLLLSSFPLQPCQLPFSLASSFLCLFLLSLQASVSLSLFPSTPVLGLTFLCPSLFSLSPSLCLKPRCLSNFLSVYCFPSIVTFLGLPLLPSSWTFPFLLLLPPWPPRCSSFSFLSFPLSLLIPSPLLWFLSAWRWQFSLLMARISSLLKGQT